MLEKLISIILPGLPVGVVNCDAYDSFSEAVTDIDTKEMTLVIFSRQNVTDDITVPSNVSLMFSSVGSLNISAGKTVTINGALEAGLYQIFEGDGSVVFGSGLVKEVYPQWWGAKGDDVTDDTVEIQAAIDAAELGIKRVYFPTPTSKYLISDRLLIDAALVRVLGSGFGCIIRQSTWEKPVFEVRADYVSIDGFYLQSTEEKTVIEGNTDGEPTRNYCAGVYLANSEFYRLTNLFVDGFCMGISPRGETDGTTLNEGGFIQNIWGKNLDQGLLIQQQKRFIAENIYIFDIEDTQGHPTHCVYTTGGSLLTHNEDLIFNNLTTWDNAESGAGRAFEFKYVKGLLANNLFASNHAGLIGTRCLESAIITNVNGHDMAETVAVNGLIEIKGNSESKNLLKNIYVENDVDDQIILRMSVAGLGGEDIEVDNLTIHDNTSTNAVMGYIQGTRTKLRNTRIICAGTARKGFVIENAADVEIENILAKNGAGDHFFEIQATATDTRLTYDGSKLIDLTGSVPILDNGTTSIITNTNVSQIATFTNGDATPSVWKTKIYTTANTGATTITMFDNGYTGQKIIVLFGDGNTTMDFTGTNLKGNAGVDWSPASGDWMECVFDGTDWHCSVYDCTA